MKKFLAIALMITATQAQAWGAREQGMLIGIAGTLLTQQIMQQPQQPHTQPQVVVGGEIHTPQGTVRGQISTQPQQPQIIMSQQQPLMYIPAPARCQVVPVYDHWGRYIAQQTVCNW